ncbi:MAG: CPBP family intramembrane glutamic endopeptidase [Pyrinomonadaceae bacterium]
MRFNTRLFVILWLAGLTGVLSLLLVDLDALIAILPIPAGTEIPTITPALKLLSLIQPAVILSVAVLIGVVLASKVGLSSPVAEAAASGGDSVSAFKPQLVPGIVGGLAGGIAVILIAAVSKPFLSPEVIARIGEFGKFLPLLTRLLYGGITEELLLRWGLMTLLVWAAWRLFQKAQDRPKPAYFVGAIVISSVVFAIGHLPIAFMLFPEPTLALTLFVIIGNSAFGLIAGYLYWKKGLESAMIAHALTHVVMFTASYFGAYF